MFRSVNNFKKLIFNNYTQRSFTLTGIKNKTHSPSNLEKRFLVWSGKYKTVADVPTVVSYESVQRCYNKVRIRVANIMIVATIIGCIAMVISGKRAAERGESVSKMNAEFHKKYNELHSNEATSK